MRELPTGAMGREAGSGRRFVVGALVVAVALASEARSQEVAPVAVGNEVRIEAPKVTSGKIQGTIEEIGDKDWVLSKGDHLVTVPREAITRLEVKAGRKGHAVEGFELGALAGVLGGSYLGLFNCSYADNSNGCFRGPFFDVAVPFALVGTGIGALVKTDRWKKVPLERVRLSLGPSRGRGARFSVSIGF